MTSVILNRLRRVATETQRVFAPENIVEMILIAEQLQGSNYGVLHHAVFVEHALSLFEDQVKWLSGDVLSFCRLHVVGSKWESPELTG